MKLNFVCVGPQRTATSWLDRALRTHPAVRLPSGVKETFFLDRRFDRGWEWYGQEYFPGPAREGVRLGEMAPTIFTNSESASRLKEHNPVTRIIVCVRNPLERSVSLYRHYHAISRVGDSLSDAILKYPEIVSASRYREHIARWVSIFGGDRVLLVPQEAVAKDALGSVNAIYAFLGVDPVDSLQGDVRDAYGSAVVPRHRALAMVADRLAGILRTAGLHALVNAGKALGLKDWLFKRSNKFPSTISLEERLELGEQLEEELHFSEQINRVGVVTAATVEHLWVAR